VTYVKRGEFKLPAQLDGFEASLKSHGISADDLQNLNILKEKKTVPMIQQYFSPSAFNVDLYKEFVSLYFLGYQGAALEDLVKALKVSDRREMRNSADFILKENYAIAYNNRATIYEAQGNFNQAILIYTQAIELNPDLAEIYLNRGNAYNRHGKFTEALKDYNKAIALKPDYANAYDDLVVTYYQLKEYDKALENLDKLEKLPVFYDPQRTSLLKRILAQRTK
jgi:tetratricopeptide (TPR) repeat protein